MALLTVGAAAATAAQAAAAPLLRSAPEHQVTVIIGSISPDIAVSGKPVTVSGWVRNNTQGTLTGLQVQLWSSATPLADRPELDGYLSGSYQNDGRIQGATAVLPASIGGGQTVRWRITVPAAELGMQQFGVYPLAAAVSDPAGTQDGVERTFLPFWPGRDALLHPFPVAWVWPLIDQPHQGICSMLDNSLAASLASGRLAYLLAVGTTSAAQAKLTWVVDPALAREAETVTRPYRVLEGGACWQTKREPGSTAARAWLSSLRTATAAQPVITTPYADPDVAALSHHGLDADLRNALRDGFSVAGQFLDHPDPTTIWPPDGNADAGIVDNLVAAAGPPGPNSLQGGIRTIVLDSLAMPPTNPALFYTPDAVTELHTGLGTTARVLLADHGLTTVLAEGATAAGSAAPGPVSAGAVTAASQRFLAETAMIAAEAPNYTRSIVVAPPRRWDPGAALASQLLADTVSAPWLRPAPLAELHPTPPPPGVPAPDLAPLPANQSSGELAGSYLEGVRDVEAAARLFESILTRQDTTFSAAIARLASSAWRGAGQPRGRYLTAQAADYLDSQVRLVQLIPSSEVTLGGSRGTVPVSIENRLSQPVKVRLEATVSASRAVPAARRLTVVSVPGKITINPHQKETVRLQVRVHSAGLTEIHLRLLSPQGAVLPSSGTLKIRSSAFGTFALVIIAVALGVLVVTIVARIIRKGMRDGRPGSVVAEGNGTDDDGFAEAPDELADARGGAQPDTH